MTLTLTLHCDSVRHDVTDMYLTLDNTQHCCVHTSPSLAAQCCLFSKVWFVFSLCLQSSEQ